MPAISEKAAAIAKGAADKWIHSYNYSVEPDLEFAQAFFNADPALASIVLSTFFEFFNKEAESLETVLEEIRQHGGSANIRDNGPVLIDFLIKLTQIAYDPEKA